MPQSTSTPEYLPVAKFAVLARTNRTTLSEAVRHGLIEPSAWVADKPVFAIADLPRVIGQLRK